MGDSHAMAYIPTFTAMAERRGWDFSVTAYPTCPWQRGIQVIYPTVTACRAEQSDWYDRVVPELDPDLIVLAHQAFDGPLRALPFVTGASGRVIGPRSASYETTLISASSSALRRLERPGRRLVVLQPMPEVPAAVNPLACLSSGESPARCVYQADPRVTPLEQYYRTGIRQPGVTSVDLDRLVCARWPVCDPIIANVIVRRDQTHLTATFARSLATPLERLIPG
jgi:hypothetical protein